MSGKKTLGPVIHPSQAASRGWSIPVMRESEFEILQARLQAEGRELEPLELPIVLKDSDLHELGANLGRELTDEDFTSIASMLRHMGNIKRVGTAEKASRQNVIATIKALAKADDATINSYFESCDTDTYSFIDEALYCEMRVELSNSPLPEQIRAAAKVALYNITNAEKGKPGRPKLGYRDMFAQETWRIWTELGGSQDAKAWEVSESGSPLALFAYHLLKMIEPETPGAPSKLSSVALLMRTFTKNQRKITT